jgi:DNA-directed RNA polymerase subunit K/omega
MNDKKLEKWLSGIDSRHRAVLVVSKRAKQIQKGLRPYFDSKSTKVTTMALEEFIQGKVDWYELSQEEIEAIRQAAIASRETEKAEAPVESEKKLFDPAPQPALAVENETEDEMDADEDVDPDKSNADTDTE